MFIPLKDNLPRSGFPLITALLIALNCFIFIAASSDPYTNGEVSSQYGVVAYELTHPGMECVAEVDQMTCGPAAEIKAANPEVDFPPAWMTVITSMFLHADWMHLIGNMLFLFVFGVALELALGRLTFFGFYILGGAAAVLLQTGWEMDAQVPMVGASGAISAVLAGYFVLFPKARVISLLFGLFPVRLAAFWVIGSWLVSQLFLAWLGAGSGDFGSVAVFAHLGGFALGVALTYLMFDSESIEECRQQALVAGIPKIDPNGRFFTSEQQRAQFYGSPYAPTAQFLPPGSDPTRPRFVKR